ncbi:hypothetical protein EZL74_06635 [Flavobacterium silvisoli]|uniref:Lipoprotein n=1 Tax=Flavobacterium silvisoli TaxID=2529433 RepID=A0A4Q9Z4Z8_9FLAO|nr:hypothetical protein [Flavobacterium silvisoli]TBX69549.1 hypothetical protein EZL74_06635 [Flavobacterium silvisoli]
MKTKILLGIIALIAVFSLTGCSKDSSTSDSAFTSDDVKASNKMDQASNDVSEIVEDQYLQQNPSAAGKTTASYVSILPSCATVTTEVTATTWTRTIVFANGGCTMPNGNVLEGSIIVSGSLNFNTPSYVINYQFVNFRHNNILIEGNKTITRTFTNSALLATNHPIHVMDINMTFTFPNGDVYTRVGTRKRECIDGFTSPMNWHDNVYLITQNITTTKPNGATHTNTVTDASPLRIEMNCQYRIVSGILTITKPNHTAVLDYGTGTCDNNATISIDGGTPTAFTFGN